MDHIQLHPAAELVFYSWCFTVWNNHHHTLRIMCFFSRPPSGLIKNKIRLHCKGLYTHCSEVVTWRAKCRRLCSAFFLSSERTSYSVPDMQHLPVWACYQSKLGLACPHTVKPGCGEGKHSIYCRMPNKQNGKLMLKRPKFLDGFQGRVFKVTVREDSIGCVISSCTILELVGINIKFQASSTFWFWLV